MKQVFQVVFLVLILSGTVFAQDVPQIRDGEVENEGIDKDSEGATRGETQSKGEGENSGGGSGGGLGINSHKNDMLYPDHKSDGRPATLRMMVGQDGEAGKGESGFTEDIIKDVAELDEEGKIKKGKYLELEKLADDLLKNQVPGEMPTPIGPAKTPIPHKYDRGTTDEEVEKNNKYDYSTILNPETFHGCMDYKMLSPTGCIKPLPGGAEVRVPFVKYHGPPQKVENVDQPLRTGYKTKKQIQEILSQFGIEDYYKYAAEIGRFDVRMVRVLAAVQACMQQQMQNGSSRVQARANCVLKTIPYTFGKRDKDYAEYFIDDMKTGVIDEKFIYRNYDNPNAGYVFNEYHLMPTGIDLIIQGMPQALQDGNVQQTLAELAIIHAKYPELTPKMQLFNPFVFEIFVHLPKALISREIFSDLPSHMLFARHTAWSLGLFPEYMVELGYDPKMCAAWDRNFNTNYEHYKSSSKSVKDGGLENMKSVDSDRITSFDNFTSKNEKKFKGVTNDAFWGTPYDLLEGYVDHGDYNPYADVMCQGANHGHWLPLSNRVNTPYHTVAASIGTVRAIKLAGRIYPFTNYTYSYTNPHGQPEMNEDGEVTPSHDGDKVQWLRNAYMDPVKDPVGPEADQGEKACHSIDRWVKKFGEANYKHYSDDPHGNQKPSKMDEFTGGNWYVAAHWRYWRGCLDPFVEGGKPYPVPGSIYEQLGEQRD